MEGIAQSDMREAWVKVLGSIVPVHDRVAATVLKADIGPADPLADRTLHPGAARVPLLLKQTLPAEWEGLMRLSLSNALAYEGPEGGDPIDLAQTTFANAQLPRTLYLVGDGCGLGGASFSVVDLSDCVTNIPLHIFGVNATLDGVAENDEENPGGFIADRTAHTNAPRTALTLEAYGPAASPGNMDLTWDSSRIHIYAAATGGSPLSQYSVPFASFIGTTLYVEGIAPGSNVLQWTYSEQTNCVDAILATILKLELDEATFQGAGEHDLKIDDGTYESEGTGDVRTPQIKAGASPKETEICYTWESSPEISATFNITPNLSTPVSAKIRIEGVQNGRSGTLFYEKDVSLSGASIVETFTTSDKLNNLIDNTTYDLSWKLSIDGGASYCTIDTTANKVFVTAGSPGGGATTLTRIERVTDECKGLVNEPDIVQKLWERVAGPASYVLGSPYPNPEWKILDGTPGECIAIANLFEKTIRMVGLTPGAGSVVYLYVEPGGGSHESPATDNFSTRDCRIGQNGHTDTIGNTHHLQNDLEKLAFVDMQGGPNNWEACYKYRHQAGDPWVWYAAGTGGASYNSVQDCMNAICDWTRWRYCNAAGFSLGSCIAPGPHPERDW